MGEERGKWSLPIINLTLEGGKSGEVYLFKEGRGEITFSGKGDVIDDENHWGQAVLVGRDG